MNFNEAGNALANIFGYAELMKIPNRERTHMIACLAAQSEYAQLTSEQIERGAKKVGFKSGKELHLKLTQMLDHAAELQRGGFAHMIIEKEVNNLQWRVIFAVKGHEYTG